MTQFDVYKNKNASTAKQYPLLLDVQHTVLDSLATRIVIPLSVIKSNLAAQMDVLAPLVEFEDNSYVMMTPQISAISAQSLQDPIGSLAQYRVEIIAALDFAFTGY